MQDHETAFVVFLKKKGQKLTYPRKLVLNAAFSLHEHFSAEKLYQIVREESSQVSLATVYRTIPLLLESGLIQQSPRSCSTETYEHILGHPKHIHWICSSCGRVMETDLEEIIPSLNNTASRVKFFLSEVKVNVTGICWNCTESENQKQ